MAIATVRRIYRICQHCGGDGKLESITQDSGGNPVVTESTCQYCNGHTLFLWGYETDNTYELEVP